MLRSFRITSRVDATLRESTTSSGLTISQLSKDSEDESIGTTVYKCKKHAKLLITRANQPNCIPLQLRIRINNLH